MGPPERSSSAYLRVLINPPTSWMARSVRPLLELSPTREFSVIVPTAPSVLLWRAISSCNSRMAGSWSDLTTSMQLSKPQVARSFLIMAASQSALVTPFPSTGYIQIDLCQKSFMTSIVIPTSPLDSSTFDVTPVSLTLM